jgi:hypothetical protein
MNFPDGLGEKAIKDVVTEHPRIGEILEAHDIACVTCGVGICLLKDVVTIHGLSPEEEAATEREIREYLDSRDAKG